MGTGLKHYGCEFFSAIVRIRFELLPKDLLFALRAIYYQVLAYSCKKKKNSLDSDLAKSVVAG